MIQPGRKYSATDGYRYGFNGKENDNEVKGEGNQQDYGMRIYDPRLGKFLSVDPLTMGYPMLTPYQFAENCPIKFIDLDGLESSAPDAKPTGITHISKATVPYGLMEEKAAYVAGNYSLFKTNASGSGGDFYTARQYHKDGRYKGMYQDDWIIGPESVTKFIDNAKDYEKKASWMDLGYNMGGSGDFSPGGLVNAGKETWNPVNIGYGISILGKGILASANIKNASSPNSNVDVYNGKFSQPNHSNNFSLKGQEILGIKSIPEAVENLKSGAWKPSTLPIDYVVRDGQVYYLNTRSIAALTEAGIPKSEWTFNNQTGVKAFETNLTNNLRGSKGYTEVTNRETLKKTKL